MTSNLLGNASIPTWLAAMVVAATLKKRRRSRSGIGYLHYKCDSASHGRYADVALGAYKTLVLAGEREQSPLEPAAVDTM
jgi:hypothetical protein